MAENILTQIKSQYNYFTRVEKSIADLIFADPHKFVTYSTSTVAKLCGVSQGSINNFAKKFSPKGFSYFKLSIARCVSYEQNVEVADIKGEIMTTMDLKIREFVSAFCHTLEINDEETLRNVVNKIAAAKKIELFGIFRSGVVAKNFCYKLKQFGVWANFENDPLVFEMSASMLGKDDLAIAISSGGTTREVVDAVSIAKKSGASIVSITSNAFSPLAKLSDFVLLTAAGKGKKQNELDNVRMSQLLLTDTIDRKSVV